MYRVIGFGTHRSRHNEFLKHTEKILSNALKYYSMLILNILKKIKEPIYIIIDDTSNKKRGKHIEAAFKFFDHVTSQYIVGQQAVCMIILYRGLVIPYSIDVYVPKEQSKTLGVPFVEKTKMAYLMLKSFEPDKGQSVYVLTDPYYAASEIINYCREKKYSFISVLKSNRVFWINNHRTNVQKYQRNNIRKRRNKQSVLIGRNRYVTITRQVDLKSGGAVKVVFSKSASHRTVKAFFTTNTALPTKKILEAYSKRWNIETFFKMSKQHLGLKAYQNRNLTTIKSRLILSLFAYDLLTHAFINDMHEKGKSLTKKNVAHFSILQMIDHIKYLVNIDTIAWCDEQKQNISKNKFISILKKFLIAA